MVSAEIKKYGWKNLFFVIARFKNSKPIKIKDWNINCEKSPDAYI